MKNQALFSSKDKSKKLKCHLLQCLFGALRVIKHLFYSSGLKSIWLCAPVNPCISFLGIICIVKYLFITSILCCCLYFNHSPPLKANKTYTVQYVLSKHLRDNQNVVA